jgi:hypothetical protein
MFFVIGGQNIKKKMKNFSVLLIVFMVMSSKAFSWVPWSSWKDFTQEYTAIASAGVVMGVVLVYNPEFKGSGSELSAKYGVSESLRKKSNLLYKEVSLTKSLLAFFNGEIWIVWKVDTKYFDD